MATTRNTRLRSVSPRLPQEGPSGFLRKLDPWFVRFAGLLRQSSAPLAAGSRARADRPSSKSEGHPCLRVVPPAVLPGWPRTLGEMVTLLAGSQDWGLTEAMEGLQEALPAECLNTPLDDVLPNILSWLKYQKMMPELQWREMQGNRKAGRQFVESKDLYNRWIHDQLPEGGIRFKTNSQHNLLMIYGLPGGLEQLTSQELADCFDQFCPCGTSHTPEVLRRLRQKLLKAGERSAGANKRIASHSGKAAPSF